MAKKNKKRAAETAPRAQQSRKPQPKKKTRREIEEENAKRAKRVRIFLIIFAIVALVAIVVTILGVVINSIARSVRLDYENDNMGAYMYLSRDEYNNISTKADIPPVDDMAIDNYIIEMLAKHKEVDKTYADENGNSKLYYGLPAGATVGAGDYVYLYYRGYTINDDGERVYFDSNYTGLVNQAKPDQNSPLMVAIGATSGDGVMIEGFALGLVGKNPNDYSSLTFTTEGTVKAGDIVAFTYTPYTASSTSTKETTILIELGDTADLAYGAGLSDFLVGQPIGSVIKNDSGTSATFDARIPGVSEVVKYSSMKVEKVYDEGDNPLVITTRFPANYQNAELSGKVAYFNVYMEQFKLYKTPELDEKFITETLKVTMEELDEYAKAESTTVVEKYRDFVRASLEAERQIEIDAAKETALWEALYKKSFVWFLPPAEWEMHFYDAISTFESNYDSSTHGTFDSYVLTQLNLEKGASWRDYLEEQAKRTVIENMAFYYVLGAEGITASGEEYEKVYEETIDTLAEALKSQNAYKDYTDEKLRELILSDYKDYVSSSALYAYGLDKLLAKVKIEVGDLGAIPAGKYTPLEF